MIPIAVLTRKCFGDDGNYDYVTEPLNLNGFKRARIAMTIHGNAPNTSGALTFEHCGVPETSQNENWTTLTPSTDAGYSTGKGVYVYVIDNFLPWVRIRVNLDNDTDGGTTLRFGEVSVNGHAFENTD